MHTGMLIHMCVNQGYIALLLQWGPSWLYLPSLGPTKGLFSSTSALGSSAGTSWPIYLQSFFVCFVLVVRPLRGPWKPPWSTICFASLLWLAASWIASLARCVNSSIMCPGTNFLHKCLEPHLKTETQEVSFGAHRAAKVKKWVGKDCPGYRWMFPQSV